MKPVNIFKQLNMSYSHCHDLVAGEGVDADGSVVFILFVICYCWVHRELELGRVVVDVCHLNDYFHVRPGICKTQWLTLKRFTRSEL